MPAPLSAGSPKRPDPQAQRRHRGGGWHAFCTLFAGLPTKEGHRMSIIKELKRRYEESRDQGAIGYIILWLLGVPASVLFVIFLLRGCD